MGERPPEWLAIGVFTSRAAGRPMSMIRSFVLRALPLVALLCVGAVVLAVAGGHTAGFAIGFAVIGVAGVLLASLFFYEVGRSEDRDRGARWNRRRPRSRSS
jgi:hypothetical protein